MHIKNICENLQNERQKGNIIKNIKQEQVNMIRYVLSNMYNMY